jgi:SAM-dependent methyltransferase
MDQPTLLRVRPDDPAYLDQAAAEKEFWQRMHPWSLESVELTHRQGSVELYWSRRFTGDENLRWYETIARHGAFRRGAILGTSSIGLEGRILETNPALHVTFFDVSEGGLERRREVFQKRFPGRIDTQVADLNFAELEPRGYDLIVSSSTIHHVTNLEHLAHTINEALTPDGHFFLEDYVGEARFRFDAEKRRVYQHLFNRDRARQGIPPCDLVWLDTSDLSPFCGVRSDEILPAFGAQLREVEVRTAGALVTPLLRSRPSQDHAHSPWQSDEWVLRQPAWSLLLGIARKRFPRLFGRNPSREGWLNPEFMHELFLFSDVLAELGLVKPNLAFARYAKRG